MSKAEDACARPLHARAWHAIALALLLIGCVRAPPPVHVVELDRPVGYVADVEPILAKRCVVCHSCYNAPCQLQLGSFEGVDRGASKLRVYDGTRLRDQAPTRLFTDATSTEQWRGKSFHSVTESRAPPGTNDSLMLHVLAGKRRSPEIRGEYQAESRDSTCAEDPDELGRYLSRHPNRAMPFGFPALSQAEYDLIATWLARGAEGPSADEQRARTEPSSAAAQAIATWEAFFNHGDAKHAMTARYLYEHLFLAHLSFATSAADGAPEFFELVRSSTPPGQPIVVIPTLRPYDSIDGDFWYRLRKIHSTIVHKTHMVVALDDAALARLTEQFIATPWLEPPHWVEVDPRTEANPFVVYAQIPPRVRYQFMLDHSHYIMQTFIQGPVCKGQVALNVIHEHFWVTFMDPDADPTLSDPEFLLGQADNLRMPIERGSDGRIVRVLGVAYRKRYADFYRAKVALYDERVPGGLDIDGIWAGEREGDTPLLTIYRHFDSASVHAGALGDLPRTVWLCDYAQFERVYYALVAGFDVFGNVSHQISVRRYMDYLRADAELNFLYFLPPDERLPILREWYQGVRAIEHIDHRGVLTDRATEIEFHTDDPKRELLERLVDAHFDPALAIEFDPLNYRRADQAAPAMPEQFDDEADLRAGLRALNAAGTGFIRHVTDTDVNLIYLRVRGLAGHDRVYTLIVNRWHDNVNSLLLETKRLDPNKDTLHVQPGSLGSYPNYFFDVEADRLPEFFAMLTDFDGGPAARVALAEFGIERDDPNFWATYDWFQQQFDAGDPLHAGRFDLNRYVD
ncbi:fatty acid cis/trans isomerase [Nannocystaceae bacterium ST9]